MFIDLGCSTVKKIKLPKVNRSLQLKPRSQKSSGSKKRVAINRTNCLKKSLVDCTTSCGACHDVCFARFIQQSTFLWEMTSRSLLLLFFFGVYSFEVIEADSTQRIGKFTKIHCETSRNGKKIIKRREGYVVRDGSAPFFLLLFVGFPHFPDILESSCIMDGFF